MSPPSPPPSRKAWAYRVRGVRVGFVCLPFVCHFGRTVKAGVFGAIRVWICRPVETNRRPATPFRTGREDWTLDRLPACPPGGNRSLGRSNLNK
jgi:hypothetical protein